jgi:hypothetical protein
MDAQMNIILSMAATLVSKAKPNSTRAAISDRSIISIAELDRRIGTTMTNEVAAWRYLKATEQPLIELGLFSRTLTVQSLWLPACCNFFDQKK